MRSLKIVYEWEKGRDLLCCWLQTVYLAVVLSQSGSYTSVQKVSGSRSCRNCAERSGGLCRAWHLLWHISLWALLGAAARSQLCFWSQRRYPREQSCFMLWRQIPAAPEKSRGRCECLAVILCWEMEEQEKDKILCISSDTRARENGSWMKGKGRKTL